jgi:endonuclease G
MIALLLLALNATTSVAKQETTEFSLACRELSSLGLPSSAVRLLCKDSFLIGYSDVHKTPLWTIKRLSRRSVPISKGDKRGPFQEDTEIPERFRSTLDDFIGSGFDRGHLAAAGNHVNDPSAYRNTFLLSNVVPQVGVGFNRGIWKSLEEEVRLIGQCTDELIVITGAYFHADRSIIARQIGGNKVSVPDALFKVLYIPSDQLAIAFTAENRVHNSRNIDDLLISIDELELKSGFDFFNRLDETTEASLEAGGSKHSWKVSKIGSRCAVS